MRHSNFVAACLLIFSLPAIAKSEGVLNDPSFLKFQKNVEECLSKRSPDCLLRYLEKRRQITELGVTPPPVGHPFFGCVGKDGQADFSSRNFSHCLFNPAAKPILQSFAEAIQARKPPRLQVAGSAILLFDKARSYRLEIEKINGRWLIVDFD